MIIKRRFPSNRLKTAICLLSTLFVPTFAIGQSRQPTSASTTPMPSLDDTPLVLPLQVRTEQQRINDYFEKILPRWSTFSPPLPESNVRVSGARPTVSYHQGQACTQTAYDLKTNPEKLVTFDPNRETLWLGALVQGQGYRDGVGSLRELPLKHRAPLRIGIDVLTKDNWRSVDSPDAITVNNTLASLIHDVVRTKKAFGSDIHFTTTITHSHEQAMLSLGLSARYAGARLKTSHAVAKDATENAVTAYFVQRMFTAYIPNSAAPSHLFSSTLTMADIAQQEREGRIGRLNPPVILQSIAFGRILYVTMVSSHSTETMKTVLNAAFNMAGQGASTSFDDSKKKILSEARISVTALGGDEENAYQLIRSGRIADYFSRAASLETMRPISYTFTNLADLSIAAIRDATTYRVTECSAVRPTAEARAHSLEIEEERRQFIAYIKGARDNWAGRSAREVRPRHLVTAAKYHGNVKTKLETLANTAIAGDRAWFKSHWLPEFRKQYDKTTREWQIGFDTNRSDHGTQGVYRRGLDLIDEQLRAIEVAQDAL